MHINIFGIVLILIGFAGIIFRRKLAQIQINYQNKTRRSPHGKKDLDATANLNLIVGSGFVVMGALTLIGKIH